MEDLATALSVTGGYPEESETPITLKGYKYDDGDIYLSGSTLYSRSAVAKWSRYLSEKGMEQGILSSHIPTIPPVSQNSATGQFQS